MRLFRMSRPSRGFGIKVVCDGRKQIFNKRIVMRRRQIFWIRKATNT